MGESVADVAKRMARAHRQEDPNTKAVYLSKHETEIRLVEVSGSVATSGDVMPFHFMKRPDLGIPYASVIVLLSEEEWAALQAGKLKLPPGWEENLEPIA